MDRMSYVDLVVPAGWVELPSTAREVTKAAAWREWAEAIPDDGSPGGFAWMEGLVSPEVQAASEALLARALEEADPDDGPPYPLAEVAAYLKAARRPPIDVRVFGAPGAVVFLCAARGPLSGVDQERLVARLVKWTGVRVDGGGGGEGYEEWVGDSYGTMDWGLGDVELRAWAAQPVFAFGAAASYDRLRPLMDAIAVRPSDDHPVRTPGVVLPAGTAVDDAPGTAFRAMQEAVSAIRQPAFVNAVRVKFGSLDFAWFPGSGVRIGESVPVRPEEALAQVWREGARDHGAPDPRGVQLYTGNVDRPAELALHAAVVRALIETCHINAPPPGTVLAPTSWGLAIDPDTLVAAPVGWFVRVGSLVLDKSKESTRVVTRYFTVGDAGLAPLKDKRAAQVVLAERIVAFARRTGALPPHTTADGATLTYAPNRYDTFTLKLGVTLAGPDPAAFVSGLRAAQPPPAEKIDEDQAPWRVEVSPSGRATCGTCREAITKGVVRLGSPSVYDDRLSWRWHHLPCGAPRLTTPEKLLGFGDLDEPFAAEVRAAIGPPRLLVSR